MSAIFLYADYPPPLVDHRHDRPQPHVPILSHLRHPNKPQLPPVATYQPDVDIRDCKAGYVIEVELPGVHDKSEIKLSWSSSRTLNLEATANRPPVSDSYAEEDAPAAAAEGTTEQPQEEPQESVLMVTERRIGNLRRHFNFPVDVEVKGIKAKLQDGLLRISVPKMSLDRTTTGSVAIE